MVILKGFGTWLFKNLYGYDGDGFLYQDRRAVMIYGNEYLVMSTQKHLKFSI